MVKIFNKSHFANEFGGEAQIKFFLDYIKAFPEECPNILRVMKIRLTVKNNDDAHIGDLCAILEGILLQTKEYCPEIFEILQIIYNKYRRTPLTLLVRIINADITCAQQGFETLIQWLKVNCWSEGKLVNLYQHLIKLLELHSELCDDIFRVTSYAVLRLENGAYSKAEAKNLFDRLFALCPELEEKAKTLLFDER